MTLEQVKRAQRANKPFFISVTPTMPHWGTCYGPDPSQGYAPDGRMALVSLHYFGFVMYHSIYFWWTNNPSSICLLDPHWEFGLNPPAPTSPCPTLRHKHSFDDKVITSFILSHEQTLEQQIISSHYDAIGESTSTKLECLCE